MQVSSSIHAPIIRTIRRRWRWRRIPSPTSTSSTTHSRVIPASRRWLRHLWWWRTIPHFCLWTATAAIVPALPAAWRCLRWRARHLLVPLSATSAAAETAYDGEEDEGADGGSDADDEWFVVVDPGFHFAAYTAADALALLAVLAMRVIEVLENALTF